MTRAHWLIVLADDLGDTDTPCSVRWPPKPPIQAVSEEMRGFSLRHYSMKRRKASLALMLASGHLASRRRTIEL